MLSSLRLRILVITLVVITLALTINAFVNYSTLQAHNDEQVADSSNPSHRVTRWPLRSG